MAKPKDKLKLSDPIDRAVAKAMRKSEPVLKDRLHGRRVLGAALERAAGIEPDLRTAIARIIYSYDQDFIARPWEQLGSLARQAYLDIAEEVLREIEKRAPCPVCNP